MHIAEGVLPIYLVVLGWIFTFIFLAISVNNLKKAPEKISLTSLFTCLCFIASLIHIPIGPTNVHLTLNGITGLILGYVSYLAIFIALFFQSIFFNFGGLLVLGINTFNIAFPALIFYFLFKKFIYTDFKILQFIIGFIAGFGSVILSIMLVALELKLVNQEFSNIVNLVVKVYIPLAILEGFITGIILVTLKPFLRSFFGGKN